jgi:CHAT domain-containing protein/tetratricopeptide (TPR) repeat protein
MGLPHHSVRVALGTLMVLLCAAVRAGPASPIAPDCEPLADSELSRISLEVNGKARATRTFSVPAGTHLLIVAFEQGVDARLEIADPAGRETRVVDSPMRRWGPQRSIVAAGRERKLEFTAVGKERARGSLDLRVFALSGSAADRVCIDAHRRLAAGDGHYARAQQISSGELTAPAGTAKSEYEAAVRDYEAAVEILKAGKGGRPLAQAEMSLAATLYQGAMKYEAAMIASQRAERAFESIADTYGVDRARAMRAVAEMEVALDTPPAKMTPAESQRRTADMLDDARATFSEVAEGQSRRGEWFDQALALNNIGLGYYYEQRFDDALGSYKRAFAIQERLGERPHQAQVLQNIALVQFEIGRFSEARASYQRVLQLIDPVESAKLYADVLNNLALAEQKSGQPDAALRHYSQALAMVITLQSTREQARSLHGLGATYYDIGNRPEAAAYFTRALELRKAESDPYGRLASLRALADVYRDSGDITGAIARREEALALAPTPASRALILVDLGRDAVQGNELDKATRYFDEVFKDDAAGDPVIYARALLERAKLYLLRGELSIAMRDVTQSRQLFQAQQLTALVFSSLLLEARISCAGGDATAAASAADKAISLAETLRRASSNPSLRASLWQPLRPAFDFRIDLLAQRRPCGKVSTKDGSLAALEIAEHARSRALEDFRQLSVARDPTSSTPEERRRAELFEALAARRAKIESLAESSVENEAWLRALRADVAKISSEIDILDAEIGARLRPGKRATRKISRPNEMIPPGVAVIEYWLGEKNSYAWLVTRERIRMFDLGPTTRIDAAARAFHGSLREFTRTPLKERLQRSRDLSVLIVAPLQADLHRYREILFIPDGALHAVPFAALTIRSGAADSFLIEEHDVSVAPAIRPLDDAPAGGAAPAQRGVLIVADPVYERADNRFAEGKRVASSGSTTSNEPTLRGSADRSGSGKAIPWQPLPGSGREAANISALFPAGAVRLLSGFEASREKLLALDLANYRILHFATHAIADSEAPQLSALILSTWNADGRPVSGEVFAGDILMKRLNADLVVLSACDTALGKASAGEGLLGLRYAAHAGGARAVVASLWPVVDTVGDFIMTSMYTAVARQGQIPAAALAQAQRAAHERWEDPAFWAVFQVSTASAGRTIH